VAELPLDIPTLSGEEEPETHEAVSEWPVDSPFEDELDVPTFLRNRNRTRGAADDEDAFEDPAFLRRSAD